MDAIEVRRCGQFWSCLPDVCSSRTNCSAKFVLGGQDPPMVCHDVCRTSSPSYMALRKRIVSPSTCQYSPLWLSPWMPCKAVPNWRMAVAMVVSGTGCVEEVDPPLDTWTTASFSHCRIISTSNCIYHSKTCIWALFNIIVPEVDLNAAVVA